jgi:hypothetical protein
MINRLLLLLLGFLFFSGSIFSQEDDSLYQSIEEVTITSEKEKKIVFEDPKYYIIDFAILDTHAFLLMRNFDNYYLYELDEALNFRHKLKLNFNANHLFEDCFQNVFVLSRDTAYFIYDHQYGLFLTEKIPKPRFSHSMEKCVGSTSEKILFVDQPDSMVREIYYLVDRETRDRKLIYEFEDSEVSRKMRRAATQLYKIGALRKEQLRSSQYEDGVRGVLEALLQDVDSIRRENEYFSRETFGVLHVRKFKYNGVFTLDDTIYVFNHYECKIDVFNQAGELVRTIPITYHLNREFNDRIYMDRVRKEFYAVYVKNGVQRLIRLGLTEGSQNTSAKITKHAYPEKVVIRDGVAYYTYKPNFDANLNKLYMQQL